MLADAPTLIDRELRGRRVDLMVGPLRRPSIEQGLEVTPLYANRPRVVVSRKSRWAGRRKVTLAELVNEPWCAPPADLAGGAVLVDAFRESGLPLPRTIVSSAAIHLCHRLLADGRFVGLSYDGSLYFDTQGPPLKVLPVEIPSRPFVISTITLKNRTISPAVALFIDCACEITKPLTRVSET